MNLQQCVVATALCAAAAAAAQGPAPQEGPPGRPIDWRPQWQPTPPVQPGYATPYLGWDMPRGADREHSREHHETSPLLKNIHTPSPLGERDRYVSGVTIVPVFELIVVPGANPCPPPYSSSACMPMR
ncbi:MAG TPA: hypothetical protein VEU32_20830 [Burkholderiales bacterium]|nr:hypothetical protein [Burkholderiales bacterium]